MNEDVIGGRGRWAVAAIGAIGVMAAFLFLVRLPAPPLTLPAPLRPDRARSLVKMARPDDTDLLLKEEMELRDLRPLFLPTDRNAALPDPRLEPGRTFLDNENLKLTFPGADVQVGKDLPPVATLNGKPVEEARPRDALAPDGADLSLLGFGRVATPIKPLLARGGYVEVTATQDGTTALAQKLPVTAGPPGDKAWSPIEFLAMVDAAGLASPLVVTESSRVEEVDVYFRNYLTREFRIGDRLVPGFYRIVIAP